MSIKSMIIACQERLDLAMKNFRYRAANNDRQKKIEERMEYAECKGKLNESLALFKSTICKQAIHIQEGIIYDRDTRVQEDELWSAA